ncbi:MAG: hypothetical protein FJY92_10880, partial [Candidatus Hydrogenedentes bacterium]|nr:hypothetical protein [Candidatus Hydrogenedentota bacterium]
MLSAIRTTTLRVLMFAACWGGAVPAFGTVYVSNEGDNTTGCSWETALYSLSAAVTLASPGESVVVAKGTYLIGGAISVPSDAKIIGGYNGDEVVGNFDLPPQNRTVLDGGNTAGSIFACSGATGVVI